MSTLQVKAPFADITNKVFNEQPIHRQTNVPWNGVHLRFDESGNREVVFKEETMQNEETFEDEEEEIEDIYEEEQGENEENSIWELREPQKKSSNMAWNPHFLQR